MDVDEKRVPFADLHLQYRSMREEIDEAIARVIRTSAYIMGPDVEAFEREFAEHSGFRQVVGVANGTDAIHLALRALGLPAGFEAIVPTHTFMATAEGVTQAGGRVKLCDVDPESLCMSARSLERAATSASRVAIPVPIYGNPAGLDETIETARRLGLRVLVDAAQAHGARLGGRRLGELCDLATYSFYPGKNLGAYGDAGAIATNDDELATTLRMWRNHGRAGKFDHEFEAVNSRLDTMQAAILRAKLRHLDEWTAGRRRVAAEYRDALSGIPGVELPREAPGAECVYHVYVIRVPDRDRVRAELEAAGIATGIHYPSPLHLLPAYRHLGAARGDFPHAEAACDSILSLPMFPEMTGRDVARVAEALRRAVRC